MLTALIRACLRFRGVVIALALGGLVYGFSELLKSKYDVFPEFAPPQVDIQVEAPGLAPEQVEALVTQPLEHAINGVAGVESLRSESIQGVSVITVTFGPGDVFRDRQAVTERLATIAGQLPQGVQAPVISPLTSSTGDLLTLGLTCEHCSLMELRTLADWLVKPRLLAVPGVAKVSPFGGEVRQLQIQVHPQRLLDYDVSLGDILAAARRATGVRGAGVLDTANQRVILQTEGQTLTAEALAKTMVVLPASGAAGSLTVPLGEVATVVEAPAPLISKGSIMGQAGVILNLWAQYGANTLEVTRSIEGALAEMKPALDAAGVTLHPDLFRPATFIQRAVDSVQHSLIIGALLVIGVLLLFLFNVRTAAISAAAIPLSLLAAVAWLNAMGASLNTMTLGGLAIAIGIVVDDAVIDVENILRRLRANRQAATPRPAVDVILDASVEVRSAVVYATFAVIIVFLPILTLSGLAGRLFAPLGIACILAIVASLFVALTVTPALCATLLNAEAIAHRASPLAAWLIARHRELLLRVHRSSRDVMAGIAVCAAAGLIALRFIGGGFLPELREGHFLVHMAAIPGTSLNESFRIGNRVTEELLRLPYVRTVAQRIGRAEADDTFGTHASEFEIDLKPISTRQAATARSDIRRTLEQFPGLSFQVNTFLMERVEETLSGYTAAVIVNVFGDDLDVLDQKAQEIAGVLTGIRGSADVQVQSPPGTPQLTLQLRPEELARWGFEPVDVLEAVGAAYQGEIVGQIYQGNQVFDVSVMLAPEHRRSIPEVGALPLRGPSGVYVPLRQLCDIRQTAGRYVVLHEGARRVQAVTCNVEGRDLQAFVQEAAQRVAAIAMPSGTYVEFGGEAASQERSKHDLLIHSLFAGAGIVILLFVIMGTMRKTLLILANLPFALVGGIVAVLLSGGGLSMGSLVGFVTLFGITLRNSIMLLSHYEHLVHVEGMPWGWETAVRGASERVVPIVMTALVTALGLLPMALGSGGPGREIEGPMAIVILGGLLTSTALNLLVLPTLALRYGAFGPPQGAMPPAAPSSGALNRLAGWFRDPPTNRLKPRFLVGAILVGLTLLTAHTTEAGLVIGILLAVAGEAIRLWANAYVGHAKVNRARQAPIGRLITAGPYAYIRNPLYFGSLLIGLGLCGIVGHLWFAVMAGGLFAWAYVNKIRQEESLLAQECGEAYARYRQAVPAYWPTWRRYADRQGQWSWEGIAASKELKTLAWVVVLIILLYFREELIEEHESLFQEHAGRRIGLLAVMVLLIASDGIYELIRRWKRRAGKS